MSGAVPAAGTLAEFLAAAGVDAELVAPGAAMPTVERAAAVLGVAPAAVVKSIVFQHKRDRARACLAVIPGDRQADRRKVAAALGLSQLKLASPQVTLQATGFPVGGVAPVGHRTPLPVVVDRRVLEHPEVWGGGGDEQHMLRIAPRLVVELTGATVADVVTDGSAQAADAARASADVRKAGSRRT